MGTGEDCRLLGIFSKKFQTIFLEYAMSVGTPTPLCLDSYPKAPVGYCCAVCFL